MLFVFFVVQSAIGQTPDSSAPPASLTPAELQVYRQAHTVIDWTPKEIRAHRELKRLEPAQSQQELGLILRRVGERVADFVQSFPNSTCTEVVRSDRVGERSGTLTRVFSDKFRYLLVKSQQGGWNGFEEYRTDAQGHAVDFNRAKVKSILTSRFALLVLYFDPHVQWACHYRYFGRQMLHGQETYVLGFAQNPDADVALAMYRDANGTAQIQVQGLAWIVTRTYDIVRLQTNLLAPPPHTNLRRETNLVDYARLSLAGGSAPLLLPRKVVVDVWEQVDTKAELMGDPNLRWANPWGERHRNPDTEIRHYRNTHVYSDYKLFRVESRIGPSP